jgi:hypothetical protein
MGNRTLKRLTIATSALLLATSFNASAQVCKGKAFSVTASATGSVLNSTSQGAIYHAARRRLNRIWKAKARARYGQSYDKVKGGTCTCKRRRSGNRVTYTCSGTARACRVGQFITSRVKCRVR